MTGWQRAAFYAQTGLGAADEQGTLNLREERRGWGAGLEAEATGAAAYAKRGPDPAQSSAPFPGFAEKLRDAEWMG